MARPPRIPASLLHGPFSRQQALDAGLTARQLQGRDFVRVLPQVFVLRDHVMTHLDWILAADLATPADAHVSGLTRIQAQGLDVGPHRPLHLVVPRDLHLVLPDVFLHRTLVMPPVDDVGTTPAAAFIDVAATGRVLDLVVVGDWLLRQGQMSMLELRELTTRDAWRPGAREASWVASFLDDRSASPKESETRALLVFAGLPTPELNVPLSDDPHGPTSDLVYHRYRAVVEFEGGQHFTDRVQIARDIGRYSGMRHDGWQYEQITELMLRSPRTVVTRVYRMLQAGGYDDPPPVFGPRWQSLFQPVRLARRLPRRVGA